MGGCRARIFLLLPRANGIKVGRRTMSALHQFNLEYNAEQDRLLFRMSTREGSEVRLWFPRRFIKRLWGLLTTLLERDPYVAAQTDPVAKKSVVAFQRDSAITSSDFTKEFEEKPAPALPLGEEPVLATKCKATPTASGSTLEFSPDHGQQVSVTLNVQYLHSLTHLLYEVFKMTDWDLDMVPVGAAGPAVRPGRLM